jgi:hypothetical protein
MDGQLSTIESDIQNYNKVKDLVIRQVCAEGYMTTAEAEEFIDRNQVLLYKGNWFSKWFDKHISVEDKDKQSYYIRMVQMDVKDPTLNDVNIRNRKLKAGIYRNVFKKLITKSYPEIMDKKELDFNEVIYNFSEGELLDTMQIIFKDQEMMSRYNKDHLNFLEDANDIAKTIGFKNGTELYLQD